MTLSRIDLPINILLQNPIGEKDKKSEKKFQKLTGKIPKKLGSTS